MKKYVLLIALAVTSMGGFAQNKLVKKAQSLIDEGKLDEAQANVSEALNSGLTKDMALAWDVQGDIYQRLFAEELNKAAAQQPMDTAKFTKNLYLCLDAYEKCNEFDEKQAYVAKNKGNLMKFRTFLMYAAQFQFQNQDYPGAFEAYEAWLDFPTKRKLVANEPTVVNDSTFDRSQVAYYACLTAYQAKDFGKVDKYLDEALTYTKEQKTVRQLHLLALLEKGDTAAWIDASKKYAVDNEEVAQNLLAHYSNKNDNKSIVAFADELLASDPNNKIANYAKGVALFGEEKYTEALPYFEKSAEIDPEFVDAIFNAGVCCCNEGYAVNEAIGKKKLKPAEYNKEIETVKDWYRKAEPYFLKIRELEPDNPMRWASRLKTVYYITGEKEKEAEMDSYLQQ